MVKIGVTSSYREGSDISNFLEFYKCYRVGFWSVAHEVIGGRYCHSSAMMGRKRGDHG